MVAAIAPLGVVTATLASWLVERVSGEAEAHEDRLTGEVAALRDQVARLSALIEDRDRAHLTATVAAKPGSGAGSVWTSIRPCAAAGVCRVGTRGVV